jgi:acetyltransferase
MMAVAAPAAPPETRAAVVEALAALAPEIDAARLDGGRPLREQVDLDSLDWVNLLDALGDRAGVALPPGRLGPGATLDELAGAVAQAQRAAAGSKRPRTRRRSPARTTRLASGRRVVLRPIATDDAQREAAFVRGLSAESRYKRFMSGLRELTPAKLQYFTDVDQVNHLALVATPTGKAADSIVGVARCVSEPDGSGGCEFAIVVDDRWQGSGLAGALMSALMRAARAVGLREMHGIVLASNRRMLRLAQQLGFTRDSQSDEPGTVRVSRRL